MFVVYVLLLAVMLDAVMAIVTVLPHVFLRLFLHAAPLRALCEKRNEISARAVGRVAREIEFLERGIDESHFGSAIQAALQHRSDFVFALTFARSRRMRPPPLYIAICLGPLDPK